jgi:hypothetical protein
MKVMYRDQTLLQSLQSLRNYVILATAQGSKKVATISGQMKFAVLYQFQMNQKSSRWLGDRRYYKNARLVANNGSVS